MKKKSILLILCLVLCLVLCACKSQEVKDLETAIDAIGTVTLESGDAIAAAESQYEAIPEEEKADVENYNTLVVARETYDALLVEEAEKKINAIGSVSLESGNVIAEARTFFDGLDPKLQKQVKNSDVLSQAEEEYAFLEKVAKNTISYTNLTPTYANTMNYTVSTWYSTQFNRATLLVLLQLQAMGEDRLEADFIDFNNQYIGYDKADGRLDFYAPYGSGGTIMGFQYWPATGKAQMGTVKTDLSIGEYVALMVEAGVIDEYKQVDINSIIKVLNALG